MSKMRTAANIGQDAQHTTGLVPFILLDATGSMGQYFWDIVSVLQGLLGLLTTPPKLIVFGGQSEAHSYPRQLGGSSPSCEQLRIELGTLNPSGAGSIEVAILHAGLIAKHGSRRLIVITDGCDAEDTSGTRINAVLDRFTQEGVEVRFFKFGTGEPRIPHSSVTEIRGRQDFERRLYAVFELESTRLNDLPAKDLERVVRAAISSLDGIADDRKIRPKGPISRAGRLLAEYLQDLGAINGWAFETNRDGILFGAGLDKLITMCEGSRTPVMIRVGATGQQDFLSIEDAMSGVVDIINRLNRTYSIAACS